MNNREIYNSIFRDVFLLDREEKLEDKNVLNVKEWNSFEHFEFLTALEKAFTIKISQEDMIVLTSYTAGLEILKKYGIMVDES